MTKNNRIIVGVLITLLVPLIIWLFATRSNEPRYEGKTVSEWLATPEVLPALPSPSPKGSSLGYLTGRPSAALNYNPRLREALDVFGTNSVPALIKHLGGGKTLRTRILMKIAASPSWPSTINSLAASNLLTPLFLVNKSHLALKHLGTNVTCAIPELAELAGSNERHWGQFPAFDLLTGLGPEGWKAIHRVLTNAPPMARSNFQFTAESAISPLLMRGDLRQREEAALALCHLDSPPFRAIPVLASIISSSEAARQIQALHGLAKLAPDYVTARDAIKQATKSDHPEVRGHAQSILDSTNRINTAAKR